MRSIAKAIPLNSPLDSMFCGAEMSAIRVGMLRQVKRLGGKPESQNLFFGRRLPRYTEFGAHQVEQDGTLPGRH